MNLFDLNVRLSHHDLHVMFNPDTNAYSLREGDQLVLHVRGWDAFINAMLIEYGKPRLNTMLGTQFEPAVMRNLPDTVRFTDVCTESLYELGYEIVFEHGGWTLASGGHPIYHCQHWDFFYRQLVAQVGTRAAIVKNRVLAFQK
jgi:hypothetical protein